MIIMLLAKEMFLFYGRKDIGTGILMNWTDGGEGPSNPSPETRKRMREGRAEALKDRPEMLGGSLGRTPEQHSADSAKADKKELCSGRKINGKMIQNGQQNKEKGLGKLD